MVRRWLKRAVRAAYDALNADECNGLDVVSDTEAFPGGPHEILDMIARVGDDTIEGNVRAVHVAVLYRDGGSYYQWAGKATNVEIAGMLGIAVSVEHARQGRE